MNFLRLHKTASYDSALRSDFLQNKYKNHYTPLGQSQIVKLGMRSTEGIRYSDAIQTYLLGVHERCGV